MCVCVCVVRMIKLYDIFLFFEARLLLNSNSICFCHTNWDWKRKKRPSVPCIIIRLGAVENRGAMAPSIAVLHRTEEKVWCKFSQPISKCWISFTSYEALHYVVYWFLHDSSLFGQQQAGAHTFLTLTSKISFPHFWLNFMKQSTRKFEKRFEVGQLTPLKTICIRTGGRPNL